MRNKALEDFVTSTKRWKVWLFLAWHSVKVKYRRTTLGPLWLTFSTGINIGGMGLIWGYLFRMDLKEFFPYLAAGMVCWSLILALITEGSDCFSRERGYIQSTTSPILLHIYKLVAVHFINFFHNILIFILVSLVFLLKPTCYMFLVPIGLAFYFVMGMAVSISLGIFCTRYRDLQPIVVSIMTLVFFVTPVMWKAEMLAHRAYLAYFNPLTHFLDVVRNPLLGKPVAGVSYMVVVACTFAAVVVSCFLFNKYRTRIVYWL